ncbi:MAG: peptide deformylase [Bacteriovoracaceae bacterium]
MTHDNIYLKDYTLEGEELEIFTYPAPVLKKVAEPVTEFNDELKELVKNMLFTMYHAPGIGLAAPQVGISKRLFVMDIEYNREEVTGANDETEIRLSDFKPMVIINPEFIEKDGNYEYEEGCLSVPGVYETVKRAKSVKVKFQDLEGNEQILEADELLAVCLQHENDHLDGVVFLERLSQLKQSFLKKKFLKLKKKMVTS